MWNTDPRKGTSTRKQLLQIPLLAATCALFLPAIAESGDLADLVLECQRLDEDALRHACFDALPDLRRGEDKKRSTTGSSDALRQGDPSEPAQAKEPTATDGVPKAQATRDPGYPMTAKITEVERTRDGRLVLELDNGTRWIEDKASQIRISVGTAVEIDERGAFGGKLWKHYEMRAGRYHLKVVPLR